MELYISFVRIRERGRTCSHLSFSFQLLYCDSRSDCCLILFQIDYLDTTAVISYSKHLYVFLSKTKIILTGTSLHLEKEIVTRGVMPFGHLT